MFRRWLPQIGLAIFLAAGAVAWGSVSIRGTNEWVFSVTRGMWVDDVGDVLSRAVAIVPGSAFNSGRPNAQLEERLRLALDLFEAGRVGTFLVSGDEEHAGHEATGMRRWLTDRGVPTARIVVDPLGIRTLETMTRAARIYGVRNAVICTQRWAAPRALFLARGAGIDAIALVPRNSSRLNAAVPEKESLKVTLAFVERYLLGRTSGSSSGTSTVAMTTPPR